MERLEIDISYHGKPAKRYMVTSGFLARLQHYAEERDYDMVITIVGSVTVP